MKVTSTITISFPKLGWGINAGDTRDLPLDESARKRILAEPGISVVGEKSREEITSKSKKDTK